MEQADMTQIDNAMVSMVQDPATDPSYGLKIRMYAKSTKNPQKSKAAGRPIFEDVDRIEVITPGSRDVRDDPVTSVDKDNFPRHWEAYQKNQTEVLVEGTPLDEWPGVTRSEANELKHFHVHTVEQLIAMSDTNAQNFRGMAQMKAKAKQFLEFAKTESSAEAVLDAQREVAQLKAQVAELVELAAKAPVEAPAAPTEDIAGMIAAGIKAAMAEVAPAAPVKKARSAAQLAGDEKRRATKAAQKEAQTE